VLAEITAVNARRLAAASGAIIRIDGGRLVAGFVVAVLLLFSKLLFS
jgi:hypothetical protein